MTSEPVTDGSRNTRVAAHQEHILRLRAERELAGDVEPWVYDNLITLAQAECEAAIEQRLQDLEWLLNEGPMEAAKRRSLELERAELERMLIRDRLARQAEAAARESAEQIRHERQAAERELQADQQQRKGVFRQALRYLAVPALLMIKLAKFKVFGTIASMVISVAAYALIWGWKFAAGFVLLILVHEYGHVLQLRREGIKASAPMFVPFLGAYVGMKELPKDAAAEARVGLAGPVLGTVGCLVPLAVWQGTGEEFWQALTYTGLLINLFNLLPVLPLDGGRAMAAISTRVWVLGYAAMAALTVIWFSPVLLLVLLFGGLELWHRFKHRHSPTQQAYHRVAPRQRAAIIAVYLGLVAVLGVGAQASYLDRGFDDIDKPAAALNVSR